MVHVFLLQEKPTRYRKRVGNGDGQRMIQQCGKVIWIQVKWGQESDQKMPFSVPEGKLHASQRRVTLESKSRLRSYPA